MFNSVTRQRAVLILDKEFSTYKGIVRIYQNQTDNIQFFSESEKLIESLQSFWSSSAKSDPTFICLLIDTEFKEILLDEWFMENTATFSIVFTSRFGHCLSFVQQCNSSFVEFIAKPFRLETTKALLDKLFTEQENRMLSVKKFVNLTKRELEICQLLVIGASTSDISKELGITIKTVKVHRANLSRKTGLKSLPELLRNFDVYSLTNLKSKNPVLRQNSTAINVIA